MTSNWNQAYFAKMSVCGPQEKVEIPFDSVRQV